MSYYYSNLPLSPTILPDSPPLLSAYDPWSSTADAITSNALTGSSSVPSLFSSSLSQSTSLLASAPLSLRQKRRFSSLEDELTLINPFQLLPNTYESLNNELWFQQPRLSDLIISMFNLNVSEDDCCEAKRFKSLLATKLTTCVSLLVTSITNKERDATHETLFQLHFLRAYFDKAPHYARVATETLQETIDSAIETICSKLDENEKAQVVRYANILDMPTREKANAFRARILPHLYRRERVGEVTAFDHWASHQEILDYTLDKLHSIKSKGMISDAYEPLNVFLNKTIPNTTNCISCAGNLIPILENFKTQLMKGIEVQLPKYFHSVTDPNNRSNRMITESYFKRNFETENSQNPLSPFVFTNGIDIASKNFSDPYVAFPATPFEWNSASDLLSYFTPEESTGFQEEKWLQFSNPLPIHMWNNHNEKVRPFAHMIVSEEVSGQQKVLDSILKELKPLNSEGTPIEIPVVTPIECHILCYFLRHFPRLAPLHFPEESRISSEQMKGLAQSAKKAKTNADHTNQIMTGILLPSYSGTQTQTQGTPFDVQQRAGFIKTVKEIQAILATVTFDADEHYLLKDPSFDSSYFKEHYKSSGLVKNDSAYIRHLIKLTLAEPLRVKEASLAGLFSNPFANRDLESEKEILSNFDLYQKKRASQYKVLCENSLFKNKGLEKEDCFPPSFRPLWEGDKGECTQLVGYHPLILFNSQALQSALFHLAFDIIEKDIASRIRFLQLKVEGNRVAFFKNLAYEILSNSDIVNEKLIFTWKEKWKGKENGIVHKFILDWRTFETVCPEGYDYRPTPNEPLFAKKLQDTLKKQPWFTPAYNFFLNNERFPPNLKGDPKSAVELFNEFIDEFGDAIYKRYFAPREHPQILTIPNDALRAILSLPNTVKGEEIKNGSVKMAILESTKNSFITPITIN